MLCTGGQRVLFRLRVVATSSQTDLGPVERAFERGDQVGRQRVGEDQGEATGGHPPCLGDADGLDQLGHQGRLQGTAGDTDDHQGLAGRRPLFVRGGGTLKNHGERGGLEEHDHDGDRDGSLACDGGPRGGGRDRTGDKRTQNQAWLEDLGTRHQTRGGEATDDKGHLGDGHAGGGPVVAGARVDLHVFDEELRKGYLAAEVDEVGGDAPPDASVPPREQRVSPLLPAAGDGRRRGHFNLGNPGGAEEDDGHKYHQPENAAAESAVEDDDAAEVGARGVLVLARHETLAWTERVGCWGPGRCVWVEDEGVGQEGRHDRADAGPRLCDQDAQRRLGAWSAVDGVRVGGALQGRDTESDDEHGGHHAGETAVLGGDRHEEIAESEAEEAGDHGHSVAAVLDQGSTDQECAGDVRGVIAGGEDGGFLAADAHGHFDVVVHDVEEAVGETPHAEERD